MTLKAGDRVRVVDAANLEAGNGFHGVEGDIVTIHRVKWSWVYLKDTVEGFGMNASRFRLIEKPEVEPVILGLMANAGAGKDTAADHLVAKHGYVKMSLADGMKRICREVYDFSNDQLWGPSHMRNAEDRRYPRKLRCKYKDVRPFSIHICSEDPDCYEYLSPRVALQTLGTEFGRFCYENTWIDQTLRDAKKVLSCEYRYNQQSGLYRPNADPFAKPAGVVIPDVRFRNELEAIKKAGGKVIRLVREGIVAGTVGVKGHASEMEQASIRDEELDAVIMVAEGIPNFQAQLDTVIPKVVSK